MAEVTLESALEKEHRDIDGGIEAYVEGLPAGLKQPEPLLRSMAGLRRHIYLEERFLFPPLREAGMMMPVMVMLREHGELWRSMDALDGLLADGADVAAVLGACRDLLAELENHNTKEEPILYTRADDVLTEYASGELATFLDEGRMPEGWVCDGVRA